MAHIFNLKPSLLDGTEKTFDYQKYAAAVLPASFDMRSKCPPVYDQGNEGSCTANAGVFARVMLLIKQFYPKATDAQIVMLSRAFLYYMERFLEGNTDQDAGASMKDIGVALQKFGVCLDSDMPYVAGNYTTVPTDANKESALAYKISDASMVREISGIKTALVTRNQPVLMGMKVFKSMESKKTAQTGVLTMPKEDEQVLGGHAVAIVGYLPKLPTNVKEKLHPFLAEEIKDHIENDACIEEIIEKVIDFIDRRKASGYFIVRNSWGANWGDHGYFYMPYEFVTKGYADEFWILEV